MDGILKLASITVVVGAFFVLGYWE